MPERAWMSPTASPFGPAFTSVCSTCSRASEPIAAKAWAASSIWMLSDITIFLVIWLFIAVSIGHGRLSQRKQAWYQPLPTQRRVLPLGISG